METWFSDQALAFLWSVALGAALGVVYDWFRIGRILHRKWWLTVFIEDLLFALIAAGATAFCFTLTNFGQVRWFLLLGEGLGFTVYFNTIGVLIAKQARFVARVLGMIRRALGRFFRFCGKKFGVFINFLKKPFIFLAGWVKMKTDHFQKGRKTGGKKRKGRKTKKGKKTQSGR